MSPDPATGVAADQGMLILVVGPSGAGKDTLIDRARAALADSPVLFPRRIVTRPATDAEVHDSLAPEAFAQAAADGAFAFQWKAHGLDYALPAAVDTALAAGETVVCNVSRGIVAMLRARYPRVFVIYIDAPLELRLARIAGRARPSEQPERANRTQVFQPADADLVIQNDGPLGKPHAAFLSAILQFC